jgi:hypothetical protein
MAKQTKKIKVQLGRLTQLLTTLDSLLEKAKETTEDFGQAITNVSFESDKPKQKDTRIGVYDWDISEIRTESTDGNVSIERWYNVKRYQNSVVLTFETRRYNKEAS